MAKIKFLKRLSRLRLALSYYRRPFIEIFKWLYNSEEDSNFNYELSELNEEYLEYLLACILGESQSKIREYFDELKNNSYLNDYLKQFKIKPHYRSRLAWFALVRASKPNLVVETGTYEGLGSLIICAALEKNKSGELYTIDNRDCGFLIKNSKYQNYHFVISNSIAALKAFKPKVDIFIHDSDHHPKYELDEYEAIQDKLNSNAIIISDNAKGSRSLLTFTQSLKKNFYYFQEIPKNHWYPGVGLGIAK